MPETGRTALIAGASGRLGPVLAAEFAAAGTDLVLAARRSPEQLARQVTEEHGVRVLPVAADVTDETSLGDLRAAVSTLNGGCLDAVVSSVTAFDGRLRRAADLDADEFRRVLDTDLAGPFLLAQAVLPFLEKSASPRVVLLSSLAGLRGRPGAAHLCAAKAGLTGLALALSWEWGELGVLVNVVAPGPIQVPDSAAHPPAGVPAFSDPRDVAAAVVFLASAANRRLTGQILTLNGGAP